MYICVCHAVTQKQIHQAISEGAGTVKQLSEQLKVTSCCGSCLESVKDCLQQPVPAEFA